MVWCCLLFVSTKAAAQQCKTYFKYTSQEHLCPPESACLIANNVTYTFSALPGAEYYLWDFGDGTSLKDSTGRVTHPYFKAGKYPVSLVAYYNAKGINPCKAIFKEEIAFEFTGGPDPKPSECSALIDNNIKGLTLKIWDEYLYNGNGDFKNTQAVYFWDFGDSTKSLNSETVHTYKNPGKYLVTLTKLIFTFYKSSEVCTASITVDGLSIKFPCYHKEICRKTYTQWVTIGETNSIASCNTRAQISINRNLINFSSCNCYTIWPMDDVKIYPAQKNGELMHPVPALNPRTYNYWSFGDGKDTVALNGSHIYAKPGKYLVKLITTSYYSDRISTAMPVYDSVMHMWLPQPMPIACRSFDSVWVEVGPEVYPSCFAKAQVKVKNQSITYEVPQPVICFFDSNWVAPAFPKTINYWTFGDGKDTVALSGTHTYAKPGKYLVVLHSAVYKSVQEFVFCYGEDFDSFVNSKIPCYYRLECRSVDSVWTEIKDNHEFNCLETTINGMDIKTHMGLYHTMEYRPGIIRHRYYNFGDGKDTMGVQEATHTYTKPGTYLVTGTEVTYYSPIWARKELHPESPIADCLVMYEDKSVRFMDSECSLREVSRVTCTEWVIINTEKLVTSVYPNPANESGNVSIENAQGNVDFMVYNSAGMLVQKVENITNGTQQFETENLANGIYLYTISKDGKVLKKDKFAVHR